MPYPISMERVDRPPQAAQIGGLRRPVLYCLNDDRPEVSALLHLLEKHFKIVIVESAEDIQRRQFHGTIVVLAYAQGETPDVAWMHDLRLRQGLPVMVLTESRALTHLESAQWDDFAVAPWEAGEVAARIWRICARQQSDATGQVYQWGKLTIDDSRHEALVNGKVLELTYTEFRLLTLLVGRNGEVVTRERAYKAVWHANPYGDLRVVDVHIRRLRQKLEHMDCRCISTVRKVGYRLVP